MFQSAIRPLRSTLFSRLLACLAVTAAWSVIPETGLASSFNAGSGMNADSTSTFPTPREVLQEGLSPHIDLMLGVSSPEGNYNTGSEFGFGFGFQPYIPFGLGMAMTYGTNSSQNKAVRNIERTTVLVRGSYHFAGNLPVIKYSHVGLATGPVLYQTTTYFGLAPFVGFDIPVQEWVGDYVSYISVGVEAKYLMVSSGDADALTINGALKYWF